MEYSIKDLENLSSIKAHTLRIWEKRYDLIKPKRTNTNIRLYSDDDLKKLLNIAALLQNGLKISEIARLSENELSQKAFFVYQNPNDFESQIKNLISAMIDFNEQVFHKIFNKSILSIGFEKTMMYIIYPFLERIGILWQTGNIVPAHEHFISNLIRQKLVVAIDSVQNVSLGVQKKFILFLPEGEFHELGLLFYAYLIKTRGHEMLYLGQSTPIESVIKSNKKWKADYLICFSTSSISGIFNSSYLSIIISDFPNTNIIVAGQGAVNVKKVNSPKVTKISSGGEFINILETMTE